MKRFLFAFFLFFLVPLSSGFDCSFFEDMDFDNCLALKEVDEDLIADLIYSSNIFPNHDLIKNYNSDIIVNTPPNNTTLNDEGVIRNAWIRIISIEPSVIYNNTLFVPQRITLRTEYDYDIQIPSTYTNSNRQNGAVCRLEYSLHNQNSIIDWYGGSLNIGNQKQITVSLYGIENIKAETTITATTRVRRHRWNRYCCSWGEHGCNRYCYSCNYRDTYYITDVLKIDEETQIKPYTEPENSIFTFHYFYSNTHQGNITITEKTNTLLSTKNSNYAENQLFFKANFTNKPYYFLQLHAYDQEERHFNNIIRNDQTIYLNENTNCEIKTTNFFETNTENCIEDYKELELERIEKKSFDANWTFIFKIIIFIIALILIFRLIKKTWGKALTPLMMILLMPALVRAESCGLTNLASCIPQKIYEFFLNLINAPLIPLLEITKNLLTAHPNINIFHGLWGIMVYILSMFFGLLFIYSGFQFLFSGHNVIKREIAKQWLKNTVIMIVLIQGSFYLYDLTIELGSVMSTAVLNLVEPTFFLITADNLINIGLEFLFIGLYALTLVITIIFLGMRYLMVAFGVIFLPLGIFCYFIPPLKTYGRLILNILAMNIFITFIAGIIILACSMMIELPIFENIKILVMINCFTIVNLLFILLTIHIIKKSTVGDGADKMAEAAKYIAMFV